MIDAHALADTIDLSRLTRDQSLELRAATEAALRREIVSMLLRVVGECTGVELKTCAAPLCGREFSVGGGRLSGSRKAEAEYCSPACRTAAWRERCKDIERAVG